MLVLIIVILFFSGAFNFLTPHESENGIWVLADDMERVNFYTLSNNGVNDVFLHYSAGDKYGTNKVEKWIQQANNRGIKVYLWMPIFYQNGEFVPVEDTDGNLNQEYIDSKLDAVSRYSKIKGIAGIQLDYLRFSQDTDSYPNPNEPLNDFANQAHEIIKSVNPALNLSITIMPETYFTLFTHYNDYGQDFVELSRQADLIVIMMYKDNYKEDSDWIKDTTNWFVTHSKGAKVMIGLQTYRSEYNSVSLSSDELSQDAKAAFDGGANGISFFRYGLTNIFNVKSIE